MLKKRTVKGCGDMLLSDTVECASVLNELILKSEKTVFFGGAGVSTESGIPDFRSADGVYSEEYGGLSPEEIVSRSFFERDPKLFYKFFREKMIFEAAKPNSAHLKLSELEKKGLLSCVITQNIDSLHFDAGSKNVLELHGTVRSGWCTRCFRHYGIEYLSMGEVPTCSCGGIISPDVVLYEDRLDDGVCSRAAEEISSAQLLIVAGTSLRVYPAAGFLRYFRGSRLVLINRDNTAFDSRADIVMRGSVGEIFERIKTD